MLGFLLALGSFTYVASTAIVDGNGTQMFADIIAHCYVLSWMLLATVVVRTVSIRQVMTMFLSGFFLAFVVALFLSRPLLDWFGSNDFTVALWVPLVEELAKAVPLVLLIWAYRRRYGQAHGVSELMVMGFAVGAGLGIHEDILYGRTIVSSSGHLLGSFTEPWGAIFPSFYWGFGGVAITHAGWGAIIGLGLALASVYLRHKVLAGFFALIALAVVVVDHSAINMRGDLAPVIKTLSMNHGLAVAVLAVGFPLAIVYDVLRRRHRPPALPKPGWALYRAGLSTRGDGWRAVMNFFALGHYRRGWTAAAYSRSSGGSTGNDFPRLIAWYRVVVPERAPEKPAGPASEPASTP